MRAAARGRSVAVLRLPTDPLPDETPADAADDRQVAEGLQDRLRREEQTAQALRAYLLEHPPER